MIKEYEKGVKSELSPHFKSLEFDCRCKYITCTITYIDTDLIDYLEKKRSEIGKPFKVESGFRCSSRNRDVGGKPGSIHMTGKAADVSVSGEDMVKLADKFEDADGLGRYPGRHFLHCDVRGYKARWVG